MNAVNEQNGLNDGPPSALTKNLTEADSVTQKMKIHVTKCPGPHSQLQHHIFTAEQNILVLFSKSSHYNFSKK